MRIPPLGSRQDHGKALLGRTMKLSPPFFVGDTYNIPSISADRVAVTIGAG